MPPLNFGARTMFVKRLQATYGLLRRCVECVAPCRGGVIFQPPTSPGLNLLETFFWSVVKRQLAPHDRSIVGGRIVLHRNLQTVWARLKGRRRLVLCALQGGDTGASPMMMILTSCFIRFPVPNAVVVPWTSYYQIAMSILCVFSVEQERSAEAVDSFSLIVASFL